MFLVFLSCVRKANFVGLCVACTIHGSLGIKHSTGLFEDWLKTSENAVECVDRNVEFNVWGGSAGAYEG